MALKIHEQNNLIVFADSYANGIRNYIKTDDTTYMKLAFTSMVSNDIENINIEGLS